MRSAQLRLDKQPSRDSSIHEREVSWGQVPGEKSKSTGAVCSGITVSGTAPAGGS